MNENAGATGTTEVATQATQAATDMMGISIAALVAILGAALLVWHVQQVKQRPATSYDKLVGGLWAAVVVLAVGRAVSLLM